MLDALAVGGFWFGGVGGMEVCLVLTMYVIAVYCIRMRYLGHACWSSNFYSNVRFRNNE